MKLYAFHLNPNPNPIFNHSKTPNRIKSHLAPPKSLFNSTPKPKSINLPTEPKTLESEQKQTLKTLNAAIPRWLLIGGASLGISFLLASQNEAMAMGPDADFWDNMRRYSLYVLTVSTGFLSAVLEPIIALLKNPITGFLIIVVLVGCGYILSQILNAMVGNSDFVYNYG